MNFQDVILTLDRFWGRKGCVVVQPYDLEVGAGTFHHHTTLKALGTRAVGCGLRPAIPAAHRRTLRR